MEWHRFHESIWFKITSFRFKSILLHQVLVWFTKKNRLIRVTYPGATYDGCRVCDWFTKNNWSSGVMRFGIRLHLLRCMFLIHWKIWFILKESFFSESLYTCSSVSIWFKNKYNKKADHKSHVWESRLNRVTLHVQESNYNCLVEQYVFNSLRRKIW